MQHKELHLGLYLDLQGLSYSVRRLQLECAWAISAAFRDCIYSAQETHSVHRDPFSIHKGAVQHAHALYTPAERSCRWN